MQVPSSASNEPRWARSAARNRSSGWRARPYRRSRTSASRPPLRSRQQSPPQRPLQAEGGASELRGSLAEARSVELTARELEALRWLASGKTNRQIAQEMLVSLSSVKAHVGASSGSSGSQTARRRRYGPWSSACFPNSNSSSVSTIFWGHPIVQWQVAIKKWHLATVRSPLARPYSVA